MIASSGSPVLVDGGSLAAHEVVEVARLDRRAALAPAALPAIERSLAVVDAVVAASEPVYGITTGFGSLSSRFIPPGLTRRLQENLLRSHASGWGEPFDREVVRAAMLLRANSLAGGYSGVRPVVIETLLGLLNAGITPVVPQRGSLGASGDLAPLAHLALALTGAGWVDVDGERQPAAEALDRHGIAPLALGPKEALALTNGTQIMAAQAVLADVDAERLLDSAIAVAALSAYGLAAHRAAFAAAVQRVRPHPGQVAVAARLRLLLEQAGLLEPARPVQDPYSLRCIPQVYGAIRDALEPLRRTLAIEINAATDNPLIFEDGTVVSGGNFHGHPLALGCDSAKTALASLGTMVERRVNLLVDGEERGLPRFLAGDPGVDSGYMIAHYLTASLVVENRVLAHPASVDSIPVSANVEDYNSMGATSARHLRQVLVNVEAIVAVEALCAAQACDLSGRLPGGPLGELLGRIRARVPVLEHDDRIVAEDVQAAVELLRSGALIAVPDGVD